MKLPPQLAVCAVSLLVAVGALSAASSPAVASTGTAPAPTTQAVATPAVATAPVSHAKPAGEAPSAASMASLKDDASESVCAPATGRRASCASEVLTDVSPLATGTPQGYSPSSLQAAYAITSASATNGAGQTVAVIDAYDSPNAEADLAVYRRQYGLPACTTANGCFHRYDQNGGTRYPTTRDTSWSFETQLDLDMVSASCPNCTIALFEASSTNVTDLGTASDSAVGLGAKFVSNSYGSPTNGQDFSDVEHYYDHPGVAEVASSGDTGAGADWPASSPNVLAVGGTSLSATSGGAWSQRAWSDGGSGCGSSGTKPLWQTDTLCTTKTTADVSAVADPQTGVAVYYSGVYAKTSGWFIGGGTSASAPLVTGMMALAGAPLAGSYPASYPYSHLGALTDITGGSNGTCGTALCNAGVGYDGPTGLGTPYGITAFTAPSTPGVTRVAGTDRYDTSARLATTTFGTRAVPVAYIASGTGFADALSGAAAAGANASPILLVSPTSIPASTASALRSLEPARIVVLGGTSAVSAGVEASLAAYTSGSVTRESGADRYATSAEIAQDAFPDPGVDVVYVATGLNFPDALSGAAIAAESGTGGGPLLLVPGTSIPAEIGEQLTRLQPRRIVILGGTSVVSPAVQSQLGTFSGSVTRIAGADRYGTSASIAADSITVPADGSGVPVVYVAVGTDFPDALSGAPVAGSVDGPVLLVQKDSVPTSIASELSALTPRSIVILGGTSAVSYAVQVALAGYVG